VSSGAAGLDAGLLGVGILTAMAAGLRSTWSP
jgi:hypothetical protein